MKNATLQSIIDMHQGAVKDFTTFLNTRCTTDTPFVVGLNGLYVEKYGRDENGNSTGEIAITINPVKAIHLSKDDAEIIAKEVTNGGNETFHAIGIYEAVTEELKRSRQLLDSIKKQYCTQSSAV